MWRCAATPDASRHARRSLDHDGTQKTDKYGKLLFEERGGHRIGYDITFSAPKDISLPYQVADEDERAKIAAVHQEANRVAMAYLENLIETRRGHSGRDVIGVQGLIWSSHMHLDARPTKDADPQCSLHTHNLVYGVAQGADGKWATFDSKEFFDNRFASDAVYKNALYQGMRALGYKLEQTEEKDINGLPTGAKTTRVAGCTDDLIEHFSARKGEILGYMHEHQVDKQTAWARTRQQKGQTEYEALSEWWDIDMKAYVDQHPNEQRLTTQALKEQTERLLKPASLDQIIARLHDHEALLEKRDIMAALAEEVMGRVSTDELYAATTRATEQLVPVAPHAIHVDDAGRTLARRHTADRYTAAWMIHQEQQVQEHTRRRMGEDRRLAPDYVTKVIADYEQRKGFSLSDEQRGRRTLHVLRDGRFGRPNGICRKWKNDRGRNLCGGVPRPGLQRLRLRDRRGLLRRNWRARRASSPMRSHPCCTKWRRVGGKAWWFPTARSRSSSWTRPAWPILRTHAICWSAPSVWAWRRS